MISPQCVACDLHKTAPGPLERTCSRHSEWIVKKSRTAPLNAIIIIIIKISSMTVSLFARHQIILQQGNQCELTQ